MLTQDLGMHHIYLTLVKLVHNYRNEGFSGANIFLCFQTDPPEILSCLVEFLREGRFFWANFSARCHLQSDFPNRVKIFSRSHFSFYTTEVVVGIQLGRGLATYLTDISCYISVLQF